MQTAHSNVCKSTPARAGSMLINIILALHFGQAGRSNGADGTADDRRWGWVMVLPFTKRREHNTLGHRYCPGRGPAMEQVYAAGNSAASQFGPLAPIAPALTPVFAAQLKEDGMSRRQQKNAQTHEAAADEPSPARLPIVPTRTSP